MAAQARIPDSRGTRMRSSQTQMATPSAPSLTTTEARPIEVQPVLHLRGASREEEIEAGGSEGAGRTRRRIQWAEDVVDNEGMGRKSSKVCCIYHAPKGIDESSDESSSDSDDSDSESGDDGSARPARRTNDHGHGHKHTHDHDHGSGKGKGKGRASSPNAYEKVPKAKTGGLKQKS